MASYVNFYETLKEAEMRLKGTVVLYDGVPHYVLCVTNHKGDGVFRIYLDDLTDKRGPAFRRIPGIPFDWFDEPGMTRGQKMDLWLDQNPDAGVIRKMMNSPAFNKFRPFPLGMVNHNGKVYYAERSPTRSTLQGLGSNMVSMSAVSLVQGLNMRGSGPDFTSRSMAMTIMGEYPSAEECVAALSDPRVGNESAAFHRLFAIFRGPLDMMFVSYKSDVVGSLPEGDLSRFILSKKFRHVKEAAEETGVFGSITIK